MYTQKPDARIDIYSHFVMVSEFTEAVRRVMNQYASRKLRGFQFHKERGKLIRTPGKAYIKTSYNRKQVAFHINCLADLKQELRNHGLKVEEFTHHVDTNAIAPAKIKLHRKFKLYDYQEEMVDYILADGHRKIVNLATGYGKGIVSLSAAERLGYRTAVICAPKYVDKWVTEIQEKCEKMTLSNKKVSGDIFVIDKCKLLVDILDGIALGDKLPPWKFVVLPITILYAYSKLYDETGEFAKDIMVHPADIWRALGIGFRITDEVHERFHANFMIDLHTHMEKTLYLSATLEPSDTFMDKMFKIMFPFYDRMGGSLYKPYIHAICWRYAHRDPSRYKAFRRGSYSHTLYEEKLIKMPKTRWDRFTPLQMYFKEIKKILDIYYIQQKKKDQKAIVFFSLVQMCLLFKNYLTQVYPDLKIVKYTAEEDFEELYRGDIVVSTPGSAGTAVDIPGLICNIMATNVDSKQLNMQIMGRLRELKKWPGQTPFFIYLSASDLEVHERYHRNKQLYFKGRVVAHQELDGQLEL